MSAPDKIWIDPAWANTFAATCGGDLEVEYVRADLLPPPAADYVAGLEAAAMRCDAAAKWAHDRSKEADEAGHDITSCIEGCVADQVTTLAKEIRNLAARPASPDTRVVTVAWLEACVDALKYWNSGSADREIKEIRAIIEGGQDRG